jgi:hypothetical protein
MDTIEGHGCCRAIAFASTSGEFDPVRQVFSRMFRPKRDRGFWFPRNTPQAQSFIENRARRARTRQHRVYALLLAGEAWRSFR